MSFADSFLLASWCFVPVTWALSTFIILTPVIVLILLSYDKYD